MMSGSVIPTVLGSISKRRSCVQWKAVVGLSVRPTPVSVRLSRPADVLLHGQICLPQQRCTNRSPSDKTTHFTHAGGTGSCLSVWRVSALFLSSDGRGLG